jgi:hypothetical protein
VWFVYLLFICALFFRHPNIEEPLCWSAAVDDVSFYRADWSSLATQLPAITAKIGAVGILRMFIRRHGGIWRWGPICLPAKGIRTRKVYPDRMDSAFHALPAAPLVASIHAAV